MRSIKKKLIISRKKKKRSHQERPAFSHRILLIFRRKKINALIIEIILKNSNHKILTNTLPSNKTNKHSFPVSY